MLQLNKYSKKLITDIKSQLKLKFKLKPNNLRQKGRNKHTQALTKYK